MKAGREHRIALSSLVMAILEEAAKTRTSEFVFRGQWHGKPLSGRSLEMVLRRMKLEGLTVHGFRSAFRDWCGEATQMSSKPAAFSRSWSTVSAAIFSGHKQNRLPVVHGRRDDIRDRLRFAGPRRALAKLGKKPSNINRF